MIPEFLDISSSLEPILSENADKDLEQDQQDRSSRLEEIELFHPSISLLFLF
jgi:hypothetical protein